MALRNSREMTFRAMTLCDSVDATNGPQGGMQSLANLIPDPSTFGLWVPRPAALRPTDFAGFMNPGFVSALLVVGDIAYGMIATARNIGHDEPFAYDIATNTFLTVSGIQPFNVPVSPLSSGDWTPPIMAQVAQRIIVTHPGFPGGAVKFGWFDISSFSSTTVGNTTGGTLITGNPTILGVEPGFAISGGSIPAGTQIESTAPFTLTESGTTHSNTTLDGLATIAGIAVGQVIAPNPTLGIGDGVTVFAIAGPAAVTMSAAATASATGNVTFTGATITMSANAAAGANGVTLTITGGTPIAPQWSAGDTNLNPLPSVPVGVAQFNGRAYYALGVNGIVYSDSLQPCQVSNATVVQALTTNDGLAVTAIGPLMQQTLLGGIVQGLIAFEGAAKMQQIQGDQATNNLSMNALPVATGTLAPLSIAPCEVGLAFISPDGLRTIGFSGAVSQPIGQSGQGVTIPFIYALFPSRICAAANRAIIRISAQNGLVPGTPVQEFWYDLTRKIWSGPHSFAASLIQPWETEFLKTPVDVTASLWKSEVTPSGNSGYVENNVALTWTWAATLSPDNAAMAMNCVIETTMSFALLAASPVNISISDERGAVLDTVQVFAVGSQSLWDQAIWDQAVWDGGSSFYQQYPLNWHLPIIFKQMVVQASGVSGYPLRVGNVYVRYEILRYKLQQPLLLTSAMTPPSQRLLSDDGIPLTSDTGAPLTGL
jgi:hypothetical protein